MKRTGKRIRNSLKNVLYLRWCMYEHFYSSLDRAVFKEHSRFEELLHAAFPGAAAPTDAEGQAAQAAPLFSRPQWQAMKRRLHKGRKPRRFSRAFINSQQEMADRQRECIRNLQHGKQGTITAPIPDKLPMPLCVGERVVARVDDSKGRLYTGYVLAISARSCTYRIEFDRSEFGIRTVADTDVTSAGETTYVPVSVLTKVKVHVPSAGITDKPKLRPPTTTSTEQVKSSVEGASLVSAELSRTINGGQDAAETGSIVDGLLQRAADVVTRSRDAASATPTQSSKESGSPEWASSDLALLVSSGRVLTAAGRSGIAGPQRVTPQPTPAHTVARLRSLSRGFYAGRPRWRRRSASRTFC